MPIPHKEMLFVMTGALLTSCAVGPDYVRPIANVPTQYKEAKGKHIISPHHPKDWKKAEPRDLSDRGRWWRIFNDPKLNELESRLNISNETILTAAANYQQARAIVDEARAAFFPTLDATWNLSRQKSNGSTSSFVSASSSGVSTGAATTKSSGNSTATISTGHSWLLNATWEPDIWGGVRRNVEAQAANAQSSDALLAATRLSAQASLAQYYFELRGADADQKFLNDTVIDYKKTLKLTLNQYKQGVASSADVVQAQSLLESAQALAINNGIVRAQYEHAIAVLIGVPPAELSIPFNPLKVTPPSIPLQVPSALLERRPDVAQAERLIAAANANIGVAVSAYYPTLSLTGSLSSVGKGLFSIPPFTWALGSQLAETLFDGGLRSATVSAMEAAYCSSVASYRQTVLAAFQNVEDNLASLRILNAQSIVQDKAAASARKALQIEINQYKSGIVPYSSVLVAEITAFTAEKSAVDVNYLRMTSAVGLIKALGGGWDACALNCAAG